MYFLGIGLVLLLMKYLEIDTADKASLLIESIFKAEHILPKTRYVIEECLEIIRNQQET